MSIMPLPVFEADADPRHRGAMTDEEIYAQLEPPKTIVVKFGAMKLVGEYPYDGEAKPGCGSKLVARTHRGTELVEMLTTTCDNAGCSKSITRNELLDYIANSGGKDYPFHTNGRILRVATIEDLNKQSSLDNDKRDSVKRCKEKITQFGLDMKLVDVEPILGGELLTFYYMSEHRVDFRELVRELASDFKTRIEMRQVGARDEARLVADYERCGQHCCCKIFLKVLKPVSMKSAKVQKATLDPLKISGRCGRLMCCLRYEDQTYKELKKNLPRRGKRVGTAYGPGVVIDGKILVQLVLVRLDFDQAEVAIPVEELMSPDDCPPPGTVPKIDLEDDPLRGLNEEQVEERVGEDQPDKSKSKRSRRDKPRAEQQDSFREQAIQRDRDAGKPTTAEDESSGRSKKRRPRRRRRGRGDQQPGSAGETAKPGKSDVERVSPTDRAEPGADSKPQKKRRRRGGRGRGKGKRDGKNTDDGGAGGSD